MHESRARRSLTRLFPLLAAMAMVSGVCYSKAAAAGPTGTVKIKNAHSNLCLSPAGGGVDKNVEIVQYPCDDDPSRSWVITPAGGGLFQIVNTKSGMCLTIAGGSTGKNDASVQFNCDQDPSRKWRYTELDQGAGYRFINLHSGLCLTVAGGAAAKNVPAVQFACDGDPSRNWKIIAKQSAGRPID